MKSIPRPRFDGDIGGADQAVTEALLAYERSGIAAEVLVPLSSSRVLVPVVALPGGTAPSEATRTDGAAGTGGAAVNEKDSSVATVLVQRGDGRKALLAFTGVDALTRWNPAARPIPVSIQQGAQAALAEGASALLIDTAGPVMFVVQEADLARLAAGLRVARTTDGDYVWWGET